MLKQKLKNWLKGQLAEILGVSVQEIDEDERFSDYGLTSLKATQLALMLKSELGQNYLPTIFFAYPTLSELVEHISNPTQKKIAKNGRKGNRQNEPIAVIGMSCRFPKAENPQEFWEFLLNGGDAISEVPLNRWDMAEYYDPDPNAFGKTNARHGAFLEADFNDFDPFFFDISPREAIEMSPAQKISLELVWEALENAGLPYRKLEGSKTGVFIGTVWNEFERIRVKKHAPINQHSAVGQSLNIVANRVSYAFGFRGPSIVVDSACSSSLLAIHLACQSLQTSDSDLAIAGGVNLMLDPETFVALSKFGGLSPDGKCKTFDVEANGYVRGEGAGMVVLKRLSEAKKDGDRIYAVVKGSAVNNDGYSNGLTAPNLEAQKSVLQDAYERSEVDPITVNYIEAHGTGTRLGDPIEIEALASVLTKDRNSNDETLRVGSVKTNIGHLEGAAGIASFIKSLFILKTHTIPKNNHFNQANPFIPFDDYRIKVQSENEKIDLPNFQKIRLGISGFGWGGTNCHVVLEEYPDETQELFVCSADSEKEMLDFLRRVKGRLKELSVSLSLKELCAEAATFHQENNKPHRVAFKVSSFKDLDKKISEIIANQGQKYYAEVEPKQTKIAFLMAPFGGQYPEMATKLYENEQVFRDSLEVCDELFFQLANWSIIEKLYQVTEEELEDVSINIPLTFAVQVSLASLYKSWGVVPSVVLGHSIGELAASHISGILSIEDATRCMYHYSRLVQETARLGDFGMAVLNYPIEICKSLLEEYETLEVAGINAPTSVNIAGSNTEIDALLNDIKNKGGKAIRILVHVAAHSTQMESALKPMEKSIGDISAIPVKVPMFSTSLGRYIKAEEINAKYWSNSIRKPVLFSESIQTLLDEGYEYFIELSAHPVLRYYLDKIFVSNKKVGNAFFSLHRDKDDALSMQNLLSMLFLNGFDINWSRIYSKYQHSLINQRAFIEKDEPFILPISAKSEQSLIQYAIRYKDFLESGIGDSQKEFFDVCSTAAIRRSHFGLRIGISGKSKHAIIEQLQDIIENEDFEAGENFKKNGSKLAFVFSGQGSQWLGMGKELFEKEIVFKDTILECERALSNYVDWKLTEKLLNPSEQDFDSVEIVQPMLFAIQVALAKLWISWGIEPDGIIGHSMGEVAGAYISESISLIAGAKIIVHRSRLMKLQEGKGGMLLTDLSYEEALEYENDLYPKINVAVSNSPKSTVLSGDLEEIQILLQKLEEEGRFCRLVKVTVASHSNHMEAAQFELTEELSDIGVNPSKIPVYSTVLGELVDGNALNNQYWGENLRKPVQFVKAIENMAQDSFSTFIEVSPHPVLGIAIRESLESVGLESLALPSLLREKPEQETIINQLATLYSHGYNPDWKAFYPSAGMFVELPSYPWYREHYEIEDKSHEFGMVQKSPLLGRKIRIADSSQNHYWEVNLSVNRLPFLRDHLIKGKYMLPVSCYFEMIHEAVNDLFPNNETFAIGNPSFTKRIEVFEEKPVQLQLKVKIMQPELLAFNFYFLPSEDAEWQECASCMVKDLIDEDEVEDAENLNTNLLARHHATEIMDREEFYKFYEKLDIHYGEYFRCVSKILQFGNEIFLKLKPDERIVYTSGKYGIHPTVMDGCFQALSLIIPKEKNHVGFKVVSMRRATFLRKPNYGEPIWVHLMSRKGYDENNKHVLADIVLFTDRGDVICVIKRMKLQEFSYVSNPFNIQQTLTASRVRQTEIDSAIPEELPVAQSEETSKEERMMSQMDLKQVENILRATVAQTIKASKSRIGLKQDFKSLGLDSLMLVALQKELQMDFGLQLQATVFWNYPNIKQLASYIHQQLQHQKGEGEKEDIWQEQSSDDLHQQEASLEETVSQLTEDELLKELDKELDGLF